MGVMWSRSGSYEFDNNGIRAPGAVAYFFEGVTSTPLTVHQDAAENTPYAETVAADGNGRWPAVFIPFGTYSLTIETAGGTTLFQASGIPNAAPVDPGEGVDADSIFQTGDTIITFKNGTRTGFVRCNGRTIGSAASGATERANEDTEDLFAFLWGSAANGQLAVSGGRGANAAADFAANKTIAMPDVRGAGLVGFADMGNSASTELDAAPVVSGSGILAASIIGGNTHALTEEEVAAHTHSFADTSSSDGAHTHTATTSSNGSHTHSGTTGAENQAHTHDTNTGSRTGTKANEADAGSAGSQYVTAANATTGNESAPHDHPFTTSSDGAHTHSLTTSSNGAHTHEISGTTGSTGSGAAHTILSRSIPVTVLMKL